VEHLHDGLSSNGVVGDDFLSVLFGLYGVFREFSKG
jgi:hypothetical protein